MPDLVPIFNLTITLQLRATGDVIPSLLDENN